MNNETHTPEPWAAHPTRVNRQTEWIIYGDSKEPRGDLAVGKLRRANYSAANARRIVACVNYCEGVPTLEIESAPKHQQLRHLLEMIDNGLPAYIASVDALAEALRGLLAAFPGDYTEPPDHIVNARAALAKLKKEAT
jgi:hypothetical protein